MKGKAVKVSPTCLAACRSLQEHGGSGVLTTQGTLLAGGEVLGDHGHAYASATWLRLVAAGLVESVEGRLKLTTAGFWLALNG